MIMVVTGIAPASARSEVGSVLEDGLDGVSGVALEAWRFQFSVS